MNNNIQIFKKQELGQVRVAGDKDSPLFCLKDVCDVLGHTNHKMVKASIINEFGEGVNQTYPLETAGGTQQATFITEPQLYFVLMRSDKPKVAFADSVASSDDTISIGQLAKLLKQNGIETGRKRLFDYFRKNGYLIKGKSKDYNTPSQKAMEQGLFKIKEAVINMGDKAILSLSPRVTSKGQQYFIEHFTGNKECMIE